MGKKYIWVVARNDGLAKTEIVSETAHTYTTPALLPKQQPRRNAKVTEWHRAFETEEAAVDFIIARASDELRFARSRAASAEERLAALKKLHGRS